MTATTDKLQYSADPPSTFTAEIQKGENGSYGVYLDRSDGRNLIVHGLGAGAVADYNRCAEPDKQLLKSDFILSVNGRSGPLECLMQFKLSKVICVVTRGFEF